MSATEAWHVTRTMRAMELLAVRPRSAPELAEALGVHVRTARRVLKRLDSEGYVTLGDDHRRRYRPTMRIVALAGQVVERAELTQVALPDVEALRGELGESVHLSVPSYLSVLCLVHGAHEGVVEPRLRELVPCHCTATGKALLAWRDIWRGAVLTQPLERHTERTLTEPKLLIAELERTCARGYAVERGEFRADARAIAAPVFSRSGDAVAALGVSGEASRLPDDRIAEVADAVVSAARALSEKLGFARAEVAQAA